MVAWFDIIKELEFKGGLVFNIQDSDIPQDHIRGNEIYHGNHALKLPINDMDFTGGVIEHIKLPSFHLTLFSPKEMKPFKEVHGLSNKEAKLKVRELIETFNKDVPNVDLMPRPHVAIRGNPETDFEANPPRLVNTEETVFFKVKNQSEWQNYLNDLADYLEIPHVKRYFHVSYSNNQGGNPYKSAGDINISDENDFYNPYRR